MPNTLRLLPAITLLTLAAACSGKAPEPSAPPANAKHVDASKAGNVAGRVVLEGAVPENPRIKLEADPYCLRAHPDGARLENFVVSNGGLENVFVYVKDGLGDYYFDVPTEPVKLDQAGCLYVPHVTGLRVKQPLEISNSDETLHNVHALPMQNQEFNQGQQFRGMKLTKTFTVPEVMVRFKCDVHGWMAAWVGVTTHPFFAITGADGTFELKGVPPGTYTVEAWHEKFGTRTAQVTVGPSQAQTASFTFTADSK